MQKVTTTDKHKQVNIVLIRIDNLKIKKIQKMQKVTTAEKYKQVNILLFILILNAYKSWCKMQEQANIIQMLMRKKLENKMLDGHQNVTTSEKHNTVKFIFIQIERKKWHLYFFVKIFSPVWLFILLSSF